MSLILVVDDQPDARELLGRLLNRAGFEVALVATAEDALAVLAVNPVMACVLDLDLGPGQPDGMDLLEDVRDGHPDLPVIVYTCHMGDRAEARARRLGAADVIEKPGHDRLVAAIREHAARFEAVLQVREDLRRIRRQLDRSVARLDLALADALR